MYTVPVLVGVKSNSVAASHGRQTTSDYTATVFEMSIGMLDLPVLLHTQTIHVVNQVDVWWMIIT